VGKNVMNGKKSNGIKISDLSYKEYQTLFREILSYTERILYNNGIFLDNCLRPILEDSVTEAILMFEKKELIFKDYNTLRIWISKTAFNMFRNTFKTYRKIKLLDSREAQRISSDRIENTYKGYTWEDLKEIIGSNCEKDDYELLEKHWLEGYSFVELAEIFKKEESTLRQKNKRILENLKVLFNKLK
jgi:DNA-directed RNA polymerase specialized sigma24 family protein